MTLTKASRDIVVPPVLSATHREALMGLATPLLSDNLDRLSGVVGLTRYNGRGKMVGTALTIKTRPGDNLFVYHAMTLMKPGHVLVIDAGGDTTNAILGDIMKSFCQHHGGAGFIVNGAIRDAGEFAASDFPCYAVGVSHRGPYKSGPGLIGVPVNIGGQVIQSGDTIVGDEDGIVTFSPMETDDLIRRATAKRDLERAMIAEITASPRPAWLYGELEKHGFDLTV
jgi:regulator of RNase E activity RraA